MVTLDESIRNLSGVRRATPINVFQSLGDQHVTCLTNRHRVAIYCPISEREKHFTETEQGWKFREPIWTIPVSTLSHGVELLDETGDKRTVRPSRSSDLHVVERITIEDGLPFLFRYVVSTPHFRAEFRVPKKLWVFTW